MGPEMVARGPRDGPPEMRLYDEGSRVGGGGGGWGRRTRACKYCRKPPNYLENTGRV